MYVNLINTKLNSDWRTYIIIPCTLSLGNRNVTTAAIVNTGAIGKGFIHRLFAQKNGLRLTILLKPINLYAFNGSRIISGQITIKASITLLI